MTKLEIIEKALTELSGEERALLRAHLDELDEQAFDDKIERDAKSGKLDELSAKAAADYKAGLTEEL